MMDQVIIDYSMILMFHLISHLYLKKKLTNDLSVLINVSLSLYQETLTRKRRLSVIIDHEVLALLDSGAIAGDLISKSVIDDLNFNASIIQVDNPKKVYSGLDNSCNVINSSIEFTLTFLNEISNINESFYFNPRILQSISLSVDLLSKPKIWL
jgi:hypothetical protein